MSEYKLTAEQSLGDEIARVRHGQSVTASDLANRLMPWMAAHDAEVLRGTLPPGARQFETDGAIQYRGVMYFPADYVLTRTDIAAIQEAARASVVAEEPQRPTSMKRFHGLIPGMLPLFHTYCEEHSGFGTCADEEQAHRDIADHLSAEHAAVKQEGGTP